MLRGRIRYSYIYIVRVSPTLSGSSAVQRVKLGDALEIRNRIVFNYYSGLLHMHIGKYRAPSQVLVNEANSDSSSSVNLRHTYLLHEEH